MTIDEKLTENNMNAEPDIENSSERKEYFRIWPKEDKSYGWGPASDLIISNARVAGLYVNYVSSYGNKVIYVNCSRTDMDQLMAKLGEQLYSFSELDSSLIKKIKQKENNAPVSGEKEKYIIPETVYFATYMSLADERIYDREWFFITTYIQENGLGEDVYNNALSIIKNLDEKPRYEDIIDTLSASNQKTRIEAISFALKISFIDQSFDELEEQSFAAVLKRFQISRRDFESLRREAQRFALSTDGDSFTAKYTDLLESRYGRSMFLNGTYKKTVNNMKKNSAEDLQYALGNTQKTAKLLRLNPEVIRREMERAKRYEARLNNREENIEVDEFFKNILAREKEILEEHENEITELQEKQKKAVDYYTISFMGRTKAGKSTLHSVLLGGINDEFIGRGSERTTRYNYVYDYYGLRIIDTPGIGAPGGAEDVEIAADVADESDLICYVVTTDSIQETEFNFLEKLKGRKKPVLILLNKKENFVRSTKKLEAFLNNPLDWYTREGEDAIQGHIDRINTYVRKHHEFHDFSIVPVQLLAAKLSLSEQDLEKRKKLREGSRIDVLLDELMQMVVQYGTIQRSQTIYNSSIFHIDQTITDIKEQTNGLSALIDKITNYSNTSVKKIDTIYNRKKKELVESIDLFFESFASNEARLFAYDHYDESKKSIQEDWQTFVAENRFEEKLKNIYTTHWDEFESDVNEVLLEIEEDMSFDADFGSLSNLKKKWVVDVKFMLNVNTAVMGIVGTILFMSPFAVAGLIVSGAAILIQLFNSFVLFPRLKSKEQQIEVAKGTLYDSIVGNIKNIKDKNTAAALEELGKKHKNIINKIEHYYDMILNSLGNIRDNLKNLEDDLNDILDSLYKAYGIRIINYMSQRELMSVSDSRKQPIIVTTEDNNFVIRVKEIEKVPLKYTSEDMSKILQENIYVGGLDDAK